MDKDICASIIRGSNHAFIVEVLIGLLTGFLSGLLGVGCGFVLVPLLIIIGIPTKVAIGSSLACIALTTLSGAIKHYKQGNCNLMLALAAISGGTPTAQLGAQATAYVEARSLEVLLGLLLLGFSLIMISQRRREETAGQQSLHPSSQSLTRHVRMRTHRINLLLSLTLGAITGFLSGLLGIGGGFLFVPLMVTVLHVPIHIAIGTGLLYVVGTAISGSIKHWALGQIDLLLVFILAMGGIVGAPIGAMATQKLSSRKLTNMFVVILFALGIKLIVIL